MENILNIRSRECAGYWAYGFAVTPFVVESFTFPTWAIVLTYIFAVLQITGCYQVLSRGPAP